MTAAATLLGGCVPVEHLDASPVSGRVVDRATSRPIANAQVVLTAQPGQEAHTQTDQDGHFQLAGLRHLHLILLPYEMYRAPNDFLRVSAAGYPQGGMIWGYRVGDRVEVLYDPQGSTDPVINTVGALWGFTLMTFVMGTAFVGVAQLAWRRPDLVS